MAGEHGSGAGSGAEGEEGERQPDELHSAFTPPLGVPLPPPPEEEHPTSEFTVPEGLRQVSEPELRSAFTPPAGLPALAPLNQRSLLWQDRMRTMVRMPLAERPAPERAVRTEGEEESGPAVPRVLDLTLRIGELLLAGGEGAEDVEAAMFGVAHAFGLDRSEPTVTFTLISITHQPSLVDDPVTLSRTVRRRGTDYTRLAAVFELVTDITSGEVTLEECYRRLADIRRNRHPFSKGALSLAGGLLAGAAAVLVGGGWLVFLLAAIGAILGDRLAWFASSRGLPEFYQFVAAAMPPAAIGAAVAIIENHVTGGLSVRTGAVITGGLYALIPGRALVAAVHDGLTGFYITASARLLEVVYLIVAIVCGVLTMLYVGRKLGAGFQNPDDLRHLARPGIQLVAAMVLAFAFCILLQQERRTMLQAVLNGGVAWLVFGSLHDIVGANVVASTVIAAGLVGLFGQLMSRYQFASSLPYITAAIGPLLPGSTTFFGLLSIAKGDLNGGMGYLATAVSVALAIAIGVNLGGELARLFMKVPGVETPLPGRRAVKRTRGF